MLTTKVCRNCKHFKPNGTWTMHDFRIQYGHCTHPTSQTIDHISGIIIYQEARKVREKDSENMCGPQGTHHVLEPSTFKLTLREIHGPEVLVFISLFAAFISLFLRVITSTA